MFCYNFLSSYINCVLSSVDKCIVFKMVEKPVFLILYSRLKVVDKMSKSLGQENVYVTFQKNKGYPR